MLLPYQLIAEFAWDWLAVDYWTSRFVIVNAMLLSVLECCTLWRLCSGARIRYRHFWGKCSGEGVRLPDETHWVHSPDIHSLYLLLKAMYQ